jgi:hypothetical protein
MPYHPGQLDGEGKPSPATTITAGVLAILGGVMAVLGGIGLLIGLAALSNMGGSSSGDAVLGLSLMGIGELILTVLLLGGGILLLNRKRAGQIMTAIGAGLAAVLFVFGIIGVSADTSFSRGFDDSGSGSTGIVFMVIGALPAVVTLVLSVIPPTTRYVRWHPGQGSTYPSTTYPSAPHGYGQPPTYGAQTYDPQAYNAQPNGGASAYGSQPPSGGFGQQSGQW